MRMKPNLALHSINIGHFRIKMITGSGTPFHKETKGASEILFFCTLNPGHYYIKRSGSHFIKQQHVGFHFINDCSL